MMLGLGAGIDYALLIIGRYREQVAAGDSRRDASAKAAATSGASVVAAGLIVMVAIAGLLVIGVPFIGKLGLASAIAVGAVVISALTILPIMIGAFGRRLKPKKPEHVLPSRFFERWGERVTGRPWLSIAAGVIVLLIFAFPVTQLRLGQPDDGNQPEERTQRVAYDLQSEAFGARLERPVPAGRRPSAGAAENERAAGRARAGRGAIRPASPASPRRSRAKTARWRRSSRCRRRRRRTAATTDLLERLREDVIPQATAGTPLKVYVGGNTAGFEDFSAKVSSRLPLFIAVVIGLSVLLLIAAFRSLWIPLVSAVFNLLSIGAAYGVVMAVFQEGIGASLIGVDSGIPIVSFIPVMMFAILFGLSMDYNVFLLSRIHEEYNEGDGPRESVIHGMGRIGKVILFAGLIMSVGVPGLRQPAGHHRQDVRPRPRPGDPDRRADRAARDRARRRDAARRPRLVAAGAGSTGSCRTSRSRGIWCRASTRSRRPTTIASRSRPRGSSAVEVSVGACFPRERVSDLLTIGDVAERSGVAASALRFYEARGLIESERAGSGHRRFRRPVLRRIAFIVFAQRIGLTLEEIGTELAKLPPDRVPTRRDWARLSSGWSARIDQRIAELERLKSGLTECIGCGCLSLDRCVLSNPGDRAGQAGPGPRYWIGDAPLTAAS